MSLDYTYYQLEHLTANWQSDKTNLVSKHPEVSETIPDWCYYEYCNTE